VYKTTKINSKSIANTKTKINHLCIISGVKLATTSVDDNEDYDGGL
jgi:hypothetical protein